MIVNVNLVNHHVNLAIFKIKFIRVVNLLTFKPINSPSIYQLVTPCDTLVTGL